MTDFLGTLKRILKSTDELMDKPDLNMECRIGHCAAFLEVGYIRALRKAGLDNGDIIEFVAMRYLKMLEQLA